MFVCARQKRRIVSETDFNRAWTGYIKGLRRQILKDLAMAKGQMRSSKEKKKPKAEWNKKKKGGAAPPTSTVGQLQSTAGQSPFAKKA
jgi:hypothetical protein